MDTNILISALIKDSFSRKIILESNFKFLSPDFSLQEIEKYKEEILEKSGITNNDFYTLLYSILDKIEIVKKDEYNYKIKEAEDIIGKIDIKDVPFIALALALGNEVSGIWTDDKDFERQNRIKVWKSRDVFKEFFRLT